MRFADKGSLMPIDDQELRALAFLAMRVRRATSGAGPWDEHGLMTNLRKIQNRSLHMTIEHVLRHAADPTAKSPGVLVGSFTPAAPKEDLRATPPKVTELCTVPGHEGYRANPCAGCHSDRLAGDEPPARAPRADATAGAAMVRATMGGA